jgi:hypothetical protein
MADPTRPQAHLVLTEKQFEERLKLRLFDLKLKQRRKQTAHLIKSYIAQKTLRDEAPGHG